MQRILEAFVSFVRFEPFLYRSVSFDRIKISCTYLPSNLAFRKKNGSPVVPVSFLFLLNEASEVVVAMQRSSQGSAGELAGNQETRTPFEADATCTTTVTSKW